jgi:hypothetical protein
MPTDKDSYIFRRGVTPNTLSVISSKNRIYAYNASDSGGATQIGVVSTFDPSEARTVEPIRGIGFGDHIAELVPGVTDPMTISITRSALYISNLYQVFGYKSGVDGIVRSLRHHRWPFDIRQELVFSQLTYNDYGPTINANNVDTPLEPGVDTGTSTGGTPGAGEGLIALITYYEACWMSDYSVSYASDTALVQETVTINVSDILSESFEAAYNPLSETLDTFNLDAISMRLTSASGITSVSPALPGSISLNNPA